MVNDWIAHFRAAARGLQVSHIWRGYGTALFVELGTLRPMTRRNGLPGHPVGEISLMIEWSWRIEEGRSIACGSWSEEAIWPEVFARLVGRKVNDVSIFSQIPEVMLSLEGNLRVTSFMTAESDPAWTLFDRRGSSPVAVGCRDGMIIADP